jgi:hypothetical protein
MRNKSLLVITPFEAELSELIDGLCRIAFVCSVSTMNHKSLIKELQIKIIANL